MIFIISERRADGVVTPEEVGYVLKSFEVNQRGKIHWENRQFIDQVGVAKAVVGKDRVLEKMEDIIGHH